jgi:hypothetical protein
MPEGHISSYRTLSLDPSLALTQRAEHGSSPPSALFRVGSMLHERPPEAGVYEEPQTTNDVRPDAGDVYLYHPRNDSTKDQQFAFPTLIGPRFR